MSARGDENDASVNDIRHNSDGCCGQTVEHDSHWWGPNRVFWCDGHARPLSSGSGDQS